MRARVHACVLSINCSTCALPLTAAGAPSDRQSGGYYKSLVAGANQVSRRKKAVEDDGRSVDGQQQQQPLLSSRDQQVELAGEKAEVEALAAGKDKAAAAEARRLAMQKVIDAYHEGAAAAAAAAAEVGNWLHISNMCVHMYVRALLSFF